MAVVKQGTAYTRMFMMVESADHITALTGASPAVNISKAGAAFGAAAGTVTEVANGWYKVALTTADTGTLGDLAYHITATSGDATDFVDQVTANILGDTLPANMTQIGGSAVSATTAQLGVNVVNWNNTVVATPATAGIPDVNVKNINNTAAATPGASGGVLIAGSNVATTIAGLTLTGAAAVTTTPAKAGLTITGGAASTSAGGTSAAAIAATGGAGAASTNGASAGASFTGGGTTTVSGADGVDMTGTGNGNGLNLLGLGTGNGLLATGGASAGGDGIQATAGGGVSVSASITGNITGNLSGSVGSVTGAVGSVTGAVGSVTGAVGSVTGNVGGNVTGSVGSISGVTFPTNFSAAAINASGQIAVDGTTALTEAYSTKGSGLTLAQSIYDMHQFLFEHATGGTTTWTVKKRNQSSTAKTFTLDSATVPTSLTEAS